MYPSDYEIGALQPAAPKGTTHGEILHVIHAFFDGLSQGKVDRDLLSSQWKDDMIRELRYPLSKGNVPDAVRVGIIQIELDKAHAAIRMEKGKGRASGELYLERTKDTWYITDIQADFSQLAKPFVRNQPFDPAEWKPTVRK